MRISGSKPECWNPVTGEIDTNPLYELKDNRTEVTLTLAPNESVFVVFSTEGISKNSGDDSQKQKLWKEKKNLAKEVREIPLDMEEYQINFLNTGKEVTRKTLFDWSKEEDEQIRYYSGTAIYKTTSVSYAHLTLPTKA